MFRVRHTTVELFPHKLRTQSTNKFPDTHAVTLYFAVVITVALKSAYYVVVAIVFCWVNDRRNSASIILKESVLKYGLDMPVFASLRSFESGSLPHWVTPSNTVKGAQTATPSSCLACGSLPRTTTAMVRRVSRLLRMVRKTS